MKKIKVGKVFIRLVSFKNKDTKNVFKITTYKTKYVSKAICFYFFKLKITIGICK